MVVNLLTCDLKFGTYTAHMRNSFKDKVVVVDISKSKAIKLLLHLKVIAFQHPRKRLL
jgi:hypothetical protein